MMAQMIDHLRELNEKMIKIVQIGKDTEDPQGKFGYEVKGSCYYALPSEDEDYPTNELGTGWLGGKHREKEFSIFTNGRPT